MRYAAAGFVVGLSLLAGSTRRAAAGDVPVHPGDTIIFYGNSFPELIQRDGHFEARLHERFPDYGLQVRSLAWTGDEVGYRLRPDGYANHLRDLLKQWPPNVVVACFGANESFAGEAGLHAYRRDLKAYVAELKARHPAARLVFLSPVAHEKLKNPHLPDAVKRNRLLKLYADATQAVVEAEGALFVDILGATARLFADAHRPLTVNGMHLTAEGSRRAGDVLMRALFGAQAANRLPRDKFARLRAAVADKAFHVAQRVRPLNGVHYYGVRARSSEYHSEMPRLNDLIDNRDKRIWGLAQGKTFRKPIDDSKIHPLAKVKPKASKGHAKEGIRKAAASRAKFHVNENVEVTLFAAESRFPDLRNPIQMAFDPRGRLWVATIASYPVWAPGERPNDKILIFEDIDGDGRADKQTVFADRLNLPDGFVLTGDGAIVSLQPAVVRLRDTDGDDRADERIELLRGFDVTDTHHGGKMSRSPDGFLWLSDGVFHRSQVETPWGVVRSRDQTNFRVDLISFEVTVDRQLASPNPWTIVHNRWGDAFQMFGGGNVGFVSAYTGWTPMGQPHRGFAGCGGGGKGCGVEIISSSHFPKEWQQGLVTNHLLGYNAVVVAPLSDTGAGYRSGRKVELIRSDDLAFRPVDTRFGLDGAMYVADFCNTVIGHAQYATRDPNRDHDHGRIWRITYKGAKLLTPPKIHGVGVPELLDLLQSREDPVRECARIELSRHKTPLVLAELSRWMDRLDPADKDYEHHLVEALWVRQRRKSPAPKLLTKLLDAKDFHARAAATRAVRFWDGHVGDTVALLKRTLQDPHPRVRMEAVIAGTWLRGKYPHLDAMLTNVNSGRDRTLGGVLGDLHLMHELEASKEVPLLRVDSDAFVQRWHMESWREEKRRLTPVVKPSELIFKRFRSQDVGPRLGKLGVYQTLLRTYLRVPAERDAIVMMSFRGGGVTISANRTPLWTGETRWSSKRQARVRLKAGMNEISLRFRNRVRENRGRLSYQVGTLVLVGLDGRTLADATWPADEAELIRLAEAFEKEHAVVRGGVIRIGTIPHRMKFSVERFTVKAGKAYTLRFTNSDVMPHNLVIGSVGSLNKIGDAADAMMTQADAAARQYVPKISQVLWATPLVQAGGKAEIKFQAPSKPGEYPFVCTFPGHWRIMRGVMVVE